MGWTFKYIGYTTSSKKALMREEIAHWTGIKVLKDAVVNGVYYAACESEKTPNQVWALVCLMRKTKDEFGYKDMEETCGPFEARCPMSIINLLTPTDSKYANDWRDACKAYNNIRKNGATVAQRLKELPIGAIIKVDGKVWEKRAPNRQFKTPFFAAYPIAYCYLPKTRIKEFEVLAQ